MRVSSRSRWRAREARHPSAISSASWFAAVTRLYIQHIGDRATGKRISVHERKMGVMAAVGAALDAGLPAVLGGRYRISRRIGQGSLAQVVEALDETSGATVALKILYPNLACNPTIAERFKREAQ